MHRIVDVDLWVPRMEIRDLVVVDEELLNQNEEDIGNSMLF